MKAIVQSCMRCCYPTPAGIIFFTETPPRTQGIIKPDNHHLYGSTGYLQPQAIVNGRKHFGRWRHLYRCQGNPLPPVNQKSFFPNQGANSIETIEIANKLSAQ